MPPLPSRLARDPESGSDLCPGKTSLPRVFHGHKFGLIARLADLLDSPKGSGYFCRPALWARPGRARRSRTRHRPGDDGPTAVSSHTVSLALPQNPVKAAWQQSHTIPEQNAVMVAPDIFRRQRGGHRRSRRPRGRPTAKSRWGSLSLYGILKELQQFLAAWARLLPPLPTTSTNLAKHY